MKTKAETGGLTAMSAQYRWASSSVEDVGALRILRADSLKEKDCYRKYSHKQPMRMDYGPIPPGFLPANCKCEDLPMRGLTQRALFLVAIMVFAGCTSEKDRLDAEAKRLCAIDGGIKVHETVTLPPEKFYENGTPQVPSEKDERGWGYYSTYEYANLKKNFEPPTLVREVTKVIRTESREVIATSVIYRRSGGGLLDGYFHPSGFHCPDDEGSDFYKRVFIQGVKK